MLIELVLIVAFTVSTIGIVTARNQEKQQYEWANYNITQTRWETEQEMEQTSEQYLDQVRKISRRY